MRFVDLYSGAGGLALGFEQAGFECVGAVDSNQDAIATHNLNRPTEMGMVEHIELGNIWTLAWVFGSVDLVIGGPPCQGFSTLGNMTRKEEEDNRRSHIRAFGSFFHESNAHTFVMENVPGLLTSEEFEAFRKQVDVEMSYGVLNAADFGVPQRRKRAFVIGSKVGRIELPIPIYTEPVTVREAWRDLPPTDTDPLVFSRNRSEKSIERYKAIPYGGNRFDLMKNRPDITPKCWLNKPEGTVDVMGRLVWEKPALTIRAEFQKPEKGRYLHPVEDRGITHREAARLQTFPDDYKFVGNLTSVARQIGNAVPPLLAKSVAAHVLLQLERYGVQSTRLLARKGKDA